MIREATTEDLGRLVQLGKQMHAESNYSVYDFNPEKLHSFLEMCIHHDDGIVLVYETEHGVIGGIVGWISEHFFGHDRVLADLSLFVDKSKRGALAGASLIKAYIEYGKQQGASQITIANSTGLEIDRVAKLYETLGLKHVGYVFSMDARGM